MNELIWLLLPVAAASGWMFAKRDARRSAAVAPALSRDYFTGLNYLLNEQPDKAIECFVRMLEVDSDTVEIHLALGNLFRQRGEVDRAIRIHQNLIARPTLSTTQRAQALLELTQDYMRAGLLDRAESLCQELIEMKEHLGRALSLLSDIYQQEKEWERAIEVTRRLQTVTGHSMDHVIAQFYCEQAEQAREKGDTDAALGLLKRALAADSDCVRASMIQGEIAVAAGDCKGAIRAYQLIERQDPAYLPEVIPALADCYRARGDTKELFDYLEGVAARHGGVTVLMIMTDLLAQQRGEDAALRFLTEHLRARASLRGVVRMIDMQAVPAAAADKLAIARQTIQALLDERPVYQCIRCGFSGKSLHWRCPGCKCWNTVKPIAGIEGE